MIWSYTEKKRNIIIYRGFIYNNYIFTYIANWCKNKCMYFQNVLIALILNSWKYIFNLHIIYNYNLDLTKTIFSMLNWSLTVIQSIAHTLNEVTLMVYYMKSFVTSIPMLFCWRKNCFYRHIFPQCFITTKWLSFLSLLIFSYDFLSTITINCDSKRSKEKNRVK